MKTKVDVMKCVLVKEKEVEYTKGESPGDVLEIAKKIGLTNAADEFIYLLCLGSSLKVNSIHLVSQGGRSSANLSLSSLFKRVLLSNCERFILVHNHPEDHTKPSNHDIVTTERIQEAAKILGLELVDHLIVTPSENYVSLRQEGYF